MGNQTRRTTPKHDTGVHTDVQAVVALDQTAVVANAKVGLEGVDLHISLHHVVVVRLHDIRVTLLVQHVTVGIHDIVGVVAQMDTHAPGVVQPLLQIQQHVKVIQRILAKLQQFDVGQLTDRLTMQLVIHIIIDIHGHQ